MGDVHRARPPFGTLEASAQASRQGESIYHGHRRLAAAQDGVATPEEIARLWLASLAHCAIAAVRRLLWTETNLSMSRQRPDSMAIPTDLWERLTDALCYAA